MAHTVVSTMALQTRFGTFSSSPIGGERKKKHMVISLDAEKAFDKIQHSLMLKVLERTGIQGQYLNIVKATIQQPRSQHQLNREKLETILLKSGNRQGCPLSPHLFTIVLEALTRAIRH